MRIYGIYIVFEPQDSKGRNVHGEENKKQNTKPCGSSTLRVWGGREKPVRGIEEATASGMGRKPGECAILKAKIKRYI